VGDRREPAAGPLEIPHVVPRETSGLPRRRSGPESAGEERPGSIERHSEKRPDEGFQLPLGRMQRGERRARLEGGLPQGSQRGRQAGQRASQRGVRSRALQAVEEGSGWSRSDRRRRDAIAGEAQSQAEREQQRAIPLVPRFQQRAR
jgi:hypothetical protein